MGNNRSCDGTVILAGPKTIQYKSKERCNFNLKMHQKLFGGQDQLRELYNTP